MWQEFKDFLLKQNALALAVGVITGAALGRVVTSVVSDLLMPVIGLGLPGGDWRQARFILTQTTGPDGAPVVSAINYGAFIGTVVDFAIVSTVVFLIVRSFLKAPEAPAAPTKGCPFCLEVIPAGAKKCRACASALA
jgi:large conductance mechanosensitive channel